MPGIALLRTKRPDMFHVDIVGFAVRSVVLRQERNRE